MVATHLSRSESSPNPDCDGWGASLGTAAGKGVLSDITVFPNILQIKWVLAIVMAV